MKVVLFLIWWSTLAYGTEVVKIWAIEYFGDWGHFSDQRNWPKITLITEICKTGDKRLK